MKPGDTITLYPKLEITIENTIYIGILPIHIKISGENLPEVFYVDVTKDPLKLEVKEIER